MIWRHLKLHRRHLAAGTILAAIAAMLPIVLLIQINRLVGSSEASIREEAFLTGIGVVVGLLAVNLIAQVFQARFAAAMLASLRADLSRRLLAIDYEALIGFKRAAVNALIIDISRIAPMLLLVPQALMQATTVLCCLGLLAYISLKLFALFSGFMIAAVAYKYAVHVGTAGIFERIRSDENVLFDNFATLADGKKELTFNRARARHFLDEVLGKGIERNRKLLESAHRTWGFGEAWTNALVYAATLTVIFCGQLWYGTSASTTTQFVVIAMFMHGPLGFLIGMSREIAQGLASVRHLQARGFALPAAEVSRDEVAPGIRSGSWSEIRVRGLSYAYPADDAHGFKFGPIDLHISRGETIFIVGGNGSGKSTLALLLSGLLTPTDGVIEIDGVKVDRSNKQDYQSLFTAVFADFHLFKHVVDRDGTLVADGEMNAWLDKLDIYGKVKCEGGVLTTLNLSQGQRKRLALAQGYVDDGDIYVFDEWAADQDPEFRAFFYNSLLPELKQRGKTALIITHDERYFHTADRTIHLEQGRLEQRVRVAMELADA